MTPSELLELTSQLEFSKRCRWKTNRSYCSPVIREEDADHIIKSLRFAADMESLYSQGRCPAFYNKGGNDPMVQLSLYDFGERVHFYAEDIYSAARDAVEALKGKE